MDYSKFEDIAKDVDKEEALEKERSRAENKEKYMREHAKKIEKWEKESGKKAPPHAHNPLNCGCGYADPDELKRIHELRKNTPQPTLEEKNAKKVMAVDATRQHGKELFENGQYKEAEQVYQQGILIIQGTYGLSEEEEKEMEKLEHLLELNLAMVALKLEHWTEALHHCNLANKLEESPKAYYRMGLAYIGLGQFKDATAALQKAEALLPNDKQVKQQLRRVKQLEEAQRKKAKRVEQKLSQKMKGLDTGSSVD
eukprot:g28193.t1